MSHRVPISVFFALFTVSGFAGLIYESIWSHYLKLFLGHAAYAQTLVLAIFMGGMALGSWLVSRFTLRIANLLLGYALAELGIGILAILFHQVFVGTTEWALDSLFPSMGSSGAIELILPASLLLGTTFPLMSAGVIRLYPEAGGRALAMLYFTNSLGAAIGVLASGFFLIAKVGLPGTILTAGLMNVVLALVVYGLTKKLPAVTPATAGSGEAGMTSIPHLARAILILAFATGAASFVYEITWIRMLTTGLGASTHAFEVMLSAFILGMSLGAFVLRGRIERLRNDLMWLATIVFAKAALAVYAVWIYGDVLDFIRWTLLATARTDGGYTLANAAGMVASMIVMFPTAFCAGMTLPLATHALARRGLGEASIGRIYGANTAGCIVGAIFATHVGMELLGVKNLTGLGAMIDVAVAALILAVGLEGAPRRHALAGAGTFCVVAAIAFASIHLDLLRMSSGVFRFGSFEDAKIVSLPFYRDGKTASISVTDNAANKRRSIRTNGKTDAAITFGEDVLPGPDEGTMILLGAIALATRPDSAIVANIGFGSGLTTHTLLGSPRVKVVDSIEIERMMIEGARLFHPRNRRAYEDARSHIHIDDAKTFFAARGQRYDVIVSEPSNPWVSGVSTLFSEEFYRQVRRHLKDDGLLVQWVQSYDISIDLLATMFKALGSQFGDYALYRVGAADLLVVATPGRALPPLSADIFTFPGTAADLAYLGYHELDDLKALRIGGRRAIEPLFAQSDFPANSDYFPVLDQNAPRARFKGESARELHAARDSLVSPLALIDGETRTPRARLARAGANWPERIDDTTVGAEAIGVFLSGDVSATRMLPPDGKTAALLAHGLLGGCVGAQLEWIEALGKVTTLASPYLTRDEVSVVFDAVRKSPCWKSLAEFPRQHVLLLEAINDRDATRMRTIGTALMERPDVHARSGFPFLAALAGGIAEGRIDEARMFWNRHEARLPPGVRDSFQARLMRAHLVVARNANR